MNGFAFALKVGDVVWRMGVGQLAYCIQAGQFLYGHGPIGLQLLSSLMKIFNNGVSLVGPLGYPTGPRGETTGDGGTTFVSEVGLDPNLPVSSSFSPVMSRTNV